MSINTFGAKQSLSFNNRSSEMFALDKVPGSQSLPFSLKILLENLLRTEDGVNITKDHINAVANWDEKAEPSIEIPYTPARVIMQDFTGVPAIVDLATMREAMIDLGGDPQKVNPLAPAELVIDHSVIADAFGSNMALKINVDLEYDRNKERYQFLRWGQGAFSEFKVVPPGTGIVHQVNIENLARVVFERNGTIYPDTVVGTDSHTTMVNGLGVLGWGVGGIEAEAAMLGQPVSMLIPKVVGFKLIGALKEGVTATDLVLTITEVLRKHGVVGKFVEFYGAGCSAVPLANRATIGNMSPEYGSTVAIFPIDDQTIDYLRFTGRSQDQLALVETYAKAQGLWLDPNHVPRFSENLELDLTTIEPSIAGPKRPQDRVALRNAKESFNKILPTYTNDLAKEIEISLDGEKMILKHGSVVIAAITSCTNTSNPEVMVGAGLLAKKAIELGLTRAPWVKTTLAPGSQVVTDYLNKAGLTPYLNKLGFDLVGYGCTTCIGNSGPLQEPISAGINHADLSAVSVLSGNRNFEGRINPDVKMNYLASPPLVVAYAIAGTMNIDLNNDAIGTNQEGKAIYLKDIWPSTSEIQEVIKGAIDSEMFTKRYADVFKGDEKWQSLSTPTGKTFTWVDSSTYVRKPPYFENMPKTPGKVSDISSARVLAWLGDSVTTDHISPAGSIKADSPAGKYLTQHGIDKKDFNSYGSRRGNHEVMIRGTFANIRLKNKLLKDVEGGFTFNFKKNQQDTIYDASVDYINDKTPLIIIAGVEYGSGSSRDWAAKGTALLGVK
ncbi:MAG: aconitate hydratase AcnA, partial [Actinobacteria bacterium]|nr:aconitate hydratase AcnA [Actinomycetota bacterium]